MNNNIKLSFIVPFYGVELYIEDCIKSLINQDMKDIEIILIDDCSIDGSLAIAEKYQKIDDRIKIIKHETNKRQGGARNTGLKHAQGEYVWFIDSDDYLVDNPSIVKNLYNQAKLTNADWLVFDLYRMIKGKKNYASSIINSSKVVSNFYLLEGSAISNFLINHNLNMAIFRYFIKKDFLQKNSCIFPEKTTSEDYVTPLWLLKAEIAAYIPKAYYVFRKRKNSTTTSKVKRNQYKDNITMLLAVAKLIDITNRESVYLGVRLLINLFLYQHPLIKEFNNSKETTKKRIVEDISITLNQISYIFNSKYFDEAIAFANNIGIPKNYNKSDILELVNALKNSKNQNQLQNVLYKAYLKLSKDNKIKKFIRNFLNKSF